MTKMSCPKCKVDMQKNQHGVYVCPTCKAVLITHDPDSIFGVTCSSI
jgi:uncharacterized Zn finger protein (UPF0148 family)